MMKPFLRAHRCFDLVVQSHNNFVAFNTALERAIKELNQLSREIDREHSDGAPGETKEKRESREVLERRDRKDRLERLDSLLHSLLEVERAVEKAKIRSYLADSIKLSRAVEIQEK